MPVKTYDKPNRSKPRYFKMCDAARIAREVVRDNPGDTPEEVLACIAKGFGFTHISLSRISVVEGSLFPVPIRGLPALIAGIIVALQALLKKYGYLLPVLKDIISLLQKITNILDKWLSEKEPDQAKVDDVISEGKCKCKPTKTGS
jgi:hypothetical protein